VFLRQLYTGATVPLTVTVNGAGTVTSNPIGVECSGTCVTEFPLNTSVTLLPRSGWHGAPSWSWCRSTITAAAGRRWPTVLADLERGERERRD
jgi:hypothetical protein